MSFKPFEQIQAEVAENEGFETLNESLNAIDGEQEQELTMLCESLDSAPYPITDLIQKGNTETNYIFLDEKGEKYRIQFYGAAKLGKNVRRVYIGKNISGTTYKDKIDTMANPKRMIATIVSCVQTFLLSNVGMKIDGLVVDLSGAAATRAIPLIVKIVKSTLISKIKLVTDKFNPRDGRNYIWFVRSTKKPEDVFYPEVEGVKAPWAEGTEDKGAKATGVNKKPEKTAGRGDLDFVDTVKAAAADAFTIFKKDTKFSQGASIAEIKDFQISEKSKTFKINFTIVRRDIPVSINVLVNNEVLPKDYEAIVKFLVGRFTSSTETQVKAMIDKENVLNQKIEEQKRVALADRILSGIQKFSKISGLGAKFISMNIKDSEVEISIKVVMFKEDKQNPILDIKCSVDEPDTFYRKALNSFYTQKCKEFETGVNQRISVIMRNGAEGIISMEMTGLGRTLDHFIAGLYVTYDGGETKKLVVHFDNLLEDDISKIYQKLLEEAKQNNPQQTKKQSSKKDFSKVRKDFLDGLAKRPVPYGFQIDTDIKIGEASQKFKGDEAFVNVTVNLHSDWCEITLSTDVFANDVYKEFARELYPRLPVQPISNYEFNNNKSSVDLRKSDFILKDVYIDDGKVLGYQLDKSGYVVDTALSKPNEVTFWNRTKRYQYRITLGGGEVVLFAGNDVGKRAGIVIGDKLDGYTINKLNSTGFSGTQEMAYIPKAKYFEKEVFNAVKEGTKVRILTVANKSSSIFKVGAISLMQDGESKLAFSVDVSLNERAALWYGGESGKIHGEFLLHKANEPTITASLEFGSVKSEFEDNVGSKSGAVGGVATLYPDNFVSFIRNAVNKLVTKVDEEIAAWYVKNEKTLEKAKSLSSLETLKSELTPLYGMKDFGNATFQVSLYNGEVNVRYDITYRRMDRGQAMKTYSNDIRKADGILDALAEKYGDKYTVTVSKARAPNEDDEYSEYEQSIGGSVTYTEGKGSTKTAPEKAPKNTKTETKLTREEIKEAAIKAEEKANSEVGAGAGFEFLYTKHDEPDFVRIVVRVKFQEGSYRTLHIDVPVKTPNYESTVQFIVDKMKAFIPSK